MSRIPQAFAKAETEQRTAIMPFVTAGYPTMEASERALLALVEAGADLIEIGVPFSDPLADGATVQRTSQRSLENGTSLSDVLAMVQRVREAGVTVPLMLMGYVNPIIKYGLERFVADAAKVGVDGFIVPDLPLEESRALVETAKAADLDYIYLVAPTTTDNRLQHIGEQGSGFIYCVSVTGVTGARSSLSDTLGDYLGRVREHIALPLAVGFGVSTPEHVQQIGSLADGAIVASALINYMDTFPIEEQADAARRYMAYLRGEAKLPSAGTEPPA